MAKKKKEKSKAGQTYFKAKNGRYYKKIVVDGKTRCRFVSNAEATGTIKPSKPKKTAGRKSQSQEEPPKLTKQKTENAISHD